MEYHAILTKEDMLKFIEEHFSALDSCRLHKIRIVPVIIEDKELFSVTVEALHHNEIVWKMVEASFTTGPLHQLGWDKKFKQICV